MHQSQSWTEGAQPGLGVGWGVGWAGRQIMRKSKLETKVCKLLTDFCEPKVCFHEKKKQDGNWGLQASSWFLRAWRKNPRRKFEFYKLVANFCKLIVCIHEKCVFESLQLIFASLKRKCKLKTDFCGLLADFCELKVCLKKKQVGNWGSLMRKSKLKTEVCKLLANFLQTFGSQKLAWSLQYSVFSLDFLFQLSKSAKSLQTSGFSLRFPHESKLSAIRSQQPARKTWFSACIYSSSSQKSA